MWVDTTPSKIPTQKYSNWPILMIRFWRFFFEAQINVYGGVDMLRIINSVVYINLYDFSKKADSNKLLLKSIWFVTGLGITT